LTFFAVKDKNVVFFATNFDTFFSDRWALRIEAAKLSDQGGYECQVTTTNKTILIVYLNVLGKNL
jgi:hypothetical protein